MGKKVVALLTLCALLNPLFLTGCSESQAPTSSQNVEVKPPDDLQAFEAEAKRWEHWIAVMDPYVSQLKNGEYVFDEAGFAEIHGQLSEADQKVVDELKQGIPVVNQKVRESQSDGAAKYWRQWYWWGYKDCYSQLSAEYILDLMQFSGWGIPLYAWAKYYYYYYRQFCISTTWAGGIWITAS